MLRNADNVTSTEEAGVEGPIIRRRGGQVSTERGEGEVQGGKQTNSTRR